MLENLKTNKELLKKGKKFNFNYYLIETSKKISNNIKVDDFAYFYQIVHVSNTNSENKDVEQAIKDLNNFKKMESNTYFYILRIKVVDLSQKEIKHPVTKLSQLVDPEIGIGLSPSNICKDLINLFSLYFGTWFKIVPNFLFWEESDSFLLIKPKFKEIVENKESSDLTLNYISITELRNEQFYLIQKSLSRFNQSIKSADDDLELSLVLLVSTIENISRKYGGIDEKFDEKIEFYHKLKKIFKNFPQNIKNTIPENLFEKIGETYLNLSHMRTKAKYKNFSLNFVSTHMKNEKFEEMIGNLYDLRSKILHAGEILGYISRDQMILYNPRNKSGKIKEYQDEKGKHLIILRIPSYNDLLKIFTDLLINFIRYLHSVKDNDLDKNHYRESDKKQRNVIMGSINKDGIKPGNVVNLSTDFYRRIDYIDLIQIQNKLKVIEKNSDLKDPEENLEKVEEILNHPNFSLNYLSFRRACCFKVFFLHALKKYDKTLEVFEKYNIITIDGETIPTFNIKAYCLALLKRFKEAHLLINQILELVEKNDEFKANYSDSKGDFYKMESNYKKAIEFYKKSLSLRKDPLWSFHKETEEKLNECIGLLKKI
jgi:tetratricopeptide (TPR) repeat protein